MAPEIKTDSTKPPKKNRVKVHLRHYEDEDLDKLPPEKFNVSKPLKSKKKHEINIRHFSDDSISESSE